MLLEKLLNELIAIKDINVENVKNKNEASEKISEDSDKVYYYNIDGHYYYFAANKPKYESDFYKMWVTDIKHVEGRDVFELNFSHMHNEGNYDSYTEKGNAQVVLSKIISIFNWHLDNKADNDDIFDISGSGRRYIVYKKIAKRAKSKGLHTAEVTRFFKPHMLISKEKISDIIKKELSA